MRGEPADQHLRHTLLGLGHLISFLDNRFTKAPLNTASRTDVHYTILQSDPEEAAKEFETWKNYLRECDGSYWGAKFVEIHRPHSQNPCVHHIAELQFADNHVAYRVVWIEYPPQTEPEPEPEEEDLCPTCGERYDDCDSITEHAWGSQTGA
jgi:hypothetical protein